MILLPKPETVEAVAAVGLRYVCSDKPGITRKRRGKGFAYFGPDGTQVKDRATIDRIQSLVIPPAWTDVWICPTPNGYLQAVGWDAKKRKQYIYHARYRETQNLRKFDHILEFGARLPRIRRAVRRDLQLPGMPKERVLALVVRLLDDTCIRVGNDEYVKQNGSFGITTLRNRHAKVKGDKVEFLFRGKSGVEQDVELQDRDLARIVKQCQDLPGEELFRYRTEKGEYKAIDSADVNEYLHQIGGQEITAKDFRTWHGSSQMLAELFGIGPCSSETDAKKRVNAALKTTAAKLGNKPSTCREYYVHPQIIQSYKEGGLFTRSGEPVLKCSAQSRRVQEAALTEFVRKFCGSRRAAA